MNSVENRMKTRIWLKKQNAMAYIGFVVTPDGRVCNESGVDITDDVVLMYSVNVFDEKTSTSFTVYEGDVVSLTYRDDYGGESISEIVVEFRNNCGGIYPFTNDYPFVNRRYEYVTVHGNIHMNPKLGEK